MGNIAKQQDISVRLQPVHAKRPCQSNTNIPVTKMKPSRSRPSPMWLLLAALGAALAAAQASPITTAAEAAAAAAATATIRAETAQVDSFQLNEDFSPKPSSYHHPATNSKQTNPFMQVHKLSPAASNNITCNDGSPIGYYTRLNNHSKSWIVYLQGGGFCGSHESCLQRSQRSPHLMSSNFWPKTKTVDGILSNNPKENPYLWNANHIFVPYCSSDSWTGLAAASQSNEGTSFTFMGSQILEQVFESLYEDLPREFSLHEAKSILLAGDSAGATGVILNLDKVNAIVQRKANSSQQPRAGCQSDIINNSNPADCEPKQAPVLRGLADSGWFLDNEPYNFGRGALETGSQGDFSSSGGSDDDVDCDRSRCTPLQSIKQAMRLWNGQVPQACADRYPLEPWRCYFGYRAYQTLKTPLFVVQWLYDEAQLMVDNIARPDTRGQWGYVNKVADEMRASLENVTALFAPSCFSHSLVIRRSWNQININGFKLPHVLNTWEEQSLSETTSAIAPKQSKEEGASPFGSGDTFASSPNRPSTAHPTDTLPEMSVPSITSQPTPESQLDSSSQLNLSSSVHSSPSQSGEGERAPTAQQQLELRHYQPSQRPPTSGTPAGSGARSRSRKRKRNNQQSRQKQARQQTIAIATAAESLPAATPELGTGQASSRDSNDLSSPVNPLLDLLPLIDRSLASADILFGSPINRGRPTIGGANNNNGRLGRSTLVDDSTLMLSNNVPDDNPNPVPSQPPSASAFENRPESRWAWSISDSRSQSSTSFAASFAHSGRHSSADRFKLMDSCGWPQCNRDCPMPDYNSGGLIEF